MHKCQTKQETLFGQHELPQKGARRRCAEHIGISYPITDTRYGFWVICVYRNLFSTNPAKS